MNKIHPHIIDLNYIYRAKDYYTGLVQYQPERELAAFIETYFVEKSNKSSDTAYMRSFCLFMKDDKYRWESEFRIVIENQYGIQNISNIYHVPVDLKI